MTKTQYDKIAARYHEETKGDVFKIFLHGKEKIHFDMIDQPHISGAKNWNVLDLGCGSGIHANYFLEQHPETRSITGIDSSNELIKIAQKNTTSRKIEFLVGDMNSLPFKDNAFDFVFSRYSIHYSKNVDRTFEEISRVVKKGGKVYFLDSHPIYTLFQKKKNDYFQKENVKFIIQGGTATITHPTFTFAEYISAIAKSKLTIVEMHEYRGRKSRIGRFAIPVSFSLLLSKK